MFVIVACLVVAIQAAAGATFWTWVRRDATVDALELVGMGLAIGSLLALAGGQLTIALGLGGWGWAIAPGVAVLALLGARAGRLQLAPVTRPERPVWIAVVIASAVGLLAIVPNVMRTPLANGYVVGGSYHTDLVFLEALSQSLARLGPGDSMLLAGEAIRYHWFAYGWIGSLTQVSGSPAFFVMTRVFPVAMTLGVAALAATWARRLSRASWVPLLAALLVVVGGYVGATQGVVLTYDSPSTAFAALLGLAFAIALTDLVGLGCAGPQGPGSALVGRRVLVAMGLLAFGLVGAKASQAAVIAVGMATLSLAAFTYTPSIRRRVWWATGITAIAMVAAYLTVLAGVAGSDTNISVSSDQAYASTFQGLDPFAGPIGVAIGTSALLLAVLPRWLGAAWLTGARGFRWAPTAAFSLGLALAGLGTLAVLRSGTNAAWFALASTALLSVVSAVGVGRALARAGWAGLGIGATRWRDPVIWSVVVALAINVVVTFTYGLAEVSGAEVLWRGPVAAWIVAGLAALVLMRSRTLHGTPWLRWAAMVTTVLVISSIGARFSGSLLWGLADSRLTPIVQQLVHVLDPTAEFPQALPITARLVTVHGASAGVRNTVPADSSDGIARSSTLIEWSPQLNAGALWLGEHAAPGELVALDDVITQPFLPIMSHVPTYLSGMPYTVGYTTAAGAQAARDREAQMTAFAEGPSSSGATTLVNDGVHWLWIVRNASQPSSTWAPWGKVTFHNDAVTIVRLSDPGANSA